jgi:hypothetical protein
MTDLTIIEAELDAALDKRCRLHREAKAKTISTRDYITGLREVREVEARLEPARRAAGRRSRAWELSAEKEPERFEAAEAREKAKAAAYRRLDQQLDVDGALHDIPPHTAILRLFEPAPNQLAGQTYIDTPNEGTERMPTTTERTPVGTRVIGAQTGREGTVRSTWAQDWLEVHWDDGSESKHWEEDLTRHTLHDGRVTVRDA